MRKGGTRIKSIICSADYLVCDDFINSPLCVISHNADAEKDTA